MVFQLLKYHSVECCSASSTTLFWDCFSPNSAPKQFQAWDIVDRTLNIEIHGELHSPGTACPFQLSSDSCLLGEITNRRYLK